MTNKYVPPKKLDLEQRLSAFPDLPDDALVHSDVVARLLDLAPATLRNHRCFQKGLPYVKVGRSVRYRVGVVRQYLAELENWEAKRQ